MILVKTDAGQLALKNRSLGLTPRQRSAFILFDGKRSVGDVLGAGVGVSEQDIDHLLTAGLLCQPEGQGVAAAAPGASSRPAAFDASTQQPVPVQDAPPPMQHGRTPQQRYQDAYPVATRLTSSLGLRGFKLNLQVEAATRYEDLVALAPKIRAAVGEAACTELDRALDV